MILESFIIGSSFLLIISKSKDSLFLNSILSYVIFWSFIPIVKILDNLSNEEIVKLNIPTGVPLVYTFDNNFHILQKNT